MRNLYEKALAKRWGVRRLLSARMASVVWAGVRETSTTADIAPYHANAKEDRMCGGPLTWKKGYDWRLC